MQFWCFPELAVVSVSSPLPGFLSTRRESTSRLPPRTVESPHAHSNLLGSTVCLFPEPSSPSSHLGSGSPSLLYCRSDVLFFSPPGDALYSFPPVLTFLSHCFISWNKHIVECLSEKGHQGGQSPASADIEPEPGTPCARNLGRTCALGERL